LPESLAKTLKRKTEEGTKQADRIEFKRNGFVFFALSRFCEKLAASTTVASGHAIRNRDPG